MTDAEKPEGKYHPPDPDLSDAAHTVARAGLSLVPVAGGPLVEFLSALITPSIQKRMHRWMTDVGEGLRALEESAALKIEDLQGNETFVDTVMQATEVARRTSNATKREALQNAVLNAALPKPPEEAIQQIFLNLIDRFGEWHIRILDLADDPVDWFDSRGQQFPEIMGALQSLIQRAFPQIADEREFFDQVWRELYDTGMVTTDSLQGMMTAQGLRASRTTKLGKQFLDFISSPLGGSG